MLLQDFINEINKSLPIFLTKKKLSFAIFKITPQNYGDFKVFKGLLFLTGLPKECKFRPVLQG